MSEVQGQREESLLQPYRQIEETINGEIDREEMLVWSRKNCHAKNVSSIVLGRDRGRLVRMFLAWPGHELEENHFHSSRLTVGFHTHRYPLQLRLLSGTVINHTATTVPVGIARDWGFRSFYMHEFFPDVFNGNPKSRCLGRSLLTLDKSTPLTDSWYSLTQQDIHTVQVVGKAAWLVAEGFASTPTTFCYSTEKALPLDGGLYHRFETLDEIDEHIREFLLLGNSSSFLAT